MALKQTVRQISPFLLSFSLIACGGGGGFGDGDSLTAENPGESGEIDISGFSLGSDIEGVFKRGVLQIGLASLSAGGSTGMSVVLQDKDGKLSTDEHTVTFTSTCITAGLAEVTSPVISSTGSFATTYIAKGCEGEDKVTAATGVLVAEGVVDVKPANIGAVEFISADPQTLLLRGMSAPGLQHTSVVKFQIKNDVGGPLTNADVSFELTTEVGGITLSAVEGTTDSEGFVSTIVQAGSVHTSVRVKAIVERNGDIISSESSQLIISTGVADQNSLSMSLSTFNPAAYNIDGVDVDVNIIASDRYNNPVPDGTTVSFYTELGVIEPSCQTTGGRCSVKWSSGGQRDLGESDGRYPHDSITTVMAKVIGEESFIDKNSNGIFDDGDQFDFLSDRGEAFEDYNNGYRGNGIIFNAYDEGLDPYLDFNGNGIRDDKDGKYTGLGCIHPTLCGENTLKDVFVSAEIVLAESNLIIEVLDSAGNRVNEIESGKVYIIRTYGAAKRQVPPAGTSISVSSSDVEIVRGAGEVPNTSFHEDDVTNPFGYYDTVLLVKDNNAEEFKSGDIKITVSDANSTSFFLSYVDNAVLLNDEAVTTNDNLVVIDVLANDLYASGDTPTVEISSNPANGTAIVENNKVTYTPNAGFVGDDTFNYTLTEGNNSIAATVNVVVTAFTAQDDTAATSNEQPVSIDILANDVFTADEIPVIEIASDPGNGTAAVSIEDNNITYTPDAGFIGTDTFSYTITDKNNAKQTSVVTITVAEFVAQSDNGSTTNEKPVSIDVLANDVYSLDETPTIEVSSSPANGSATVEIDKIRYTPFPGFIGTDTFNYTITNESGATEQATVSINVTAFIAQNDIVATTDNRLVIIDVLANDSFKTGNLPTLALSTNPGSGIATVENDQINYRPNPGFVGTDTFSYTITNENNSIETATVSIMVTAFAALDDSAATTNQNPVTIDILANDSFRTGSALTIALASTPSNGTAVIDSDNIVYTPNVGFFGTDVFNYSVTDDNNTTKSATVSVTVTEFVAQNDFASTVNQKEVAIDILANDTFSSSINPAVAITSSSSNGTVTVDVDKVKYTPNAGFVGTDTFGYSITDENDTVVTASVNVSVTAFSAQDDNATTENDSSVSINVLFNDVYQSNNTPTIAISSVAGNGLATVAGSTISYTPTLGFVGLDTFSYTIIDQNNNNATARVNVTVTAPPTPTPTPTPAPATP